MRHRAWIGRGRLILRTYLFERSRLQHDEIVRHEIVILEKDFKRLAGLHDNTILVVKHLIGERG